MCAQRTQNCFHFCVEGPDGKLIWCTDQQNEPDEKAKSPKQQEHAPADDEPDEKAKSPKQPEHPPADETTKHESR